MVIGFYVLSALKIKSAVNLWLIAGSLFFYSYWLPQYLPLMLGSIFLNFLFHRLIQRSAGSLNSKLFLIVGCIFNVALLGYYKYSDFFIENIAVVFQIENPSLLNLALPLGISFFTFQQIAFLVDTYQNLTGKYNPLNYSLFVCFFPQLIAGPIVHHKEMMPQFGSPKTSRINFENIYIGLFFIALGFFKKVGIADTLAVWVNQGFNAPEKLSFWEAWRTSLSYTFQLYFDFSGYTDMALGSARLFNIKLPLNFNSPYIALNIQDFWRRWHITLGRFLKDYVYIVLGGNKNGRIKTLRNLFLTFLIGGIWHGAGWTFVVWGALHGAAMVIHRIWQKNGKRLPKHLAWFITFLFVNMAWVYFRAEEIKTAHIILLAMVQFDVSNLIDTINFLFSAKFLKIPLWLSLIFVFILQDMFFKNSQQWAERCRPNIRYTTCSGLLFGIGTLLLMQDNRFSEFIYFQF